MPHTTFLYYNATTCFTDFKFTDKENKENSRTHEWMTEQQDRGWRVKGCFGGSALLNSTVESTSTFIFAYMKHFWNKTLMKVYLLFIWNPTTFEMISHENQYFCIYCFWWLFTTSPVLVITIGKERAVWICDVNRFSFSLQRYKYNPVTISESIFWAESMSRLCSPFHNPPVSLNSPAAPVSK